MLKGTTRQGFEFCLDDSVMDDWELLELLREIEKGNTSIVVDALCYLLGSEQYEKLKESVRAEGKITITGMVNALEDILGANEESKN